MNYKLVLRVTGFALLLEAACLLLPTLVAVIYREDPMPFLWSILILVVVGAALSLLLKGRTSSNLLPRDGFLTVGLIWTLFGVFGALPFRFSGLFGNFVNCFFECISGFTTTGSSILTAVEGLPYGLLFWRSFTNWLGGMGVLVLTAALLPSLGISSNFLIRAESPGPVKSKLVPRASQSSKILYSIYLAFTVIETVLLRIAGRPWYDAIVLSFSTAGTGGFSIKNASVGAYGSPAVEIIVIIFLILFSLNFAMYFLLLTRRFKQVLQSDELRFFLLMVLLASIAITVNIAPSFDRLGDAIRTAVFQVMTVVSTAGFATADFNLWPEFSRMLLVILMLVGACAGSTGGGMKCSRVLVLFRSSAREIRTIIHPRSVSVVRLDGEPLSEQTVRTTQCYFIIYMFLTFGASLIIGLDNFSFGTTLTAVISCVNNIGPGLEAVGPMGNFAGFSDLSKLVLSFCMILGRLEMFPILVLFSRNAWKKH